jgi:hypothetical protein
MCTVNRSPGASSTASDSSSTGLPLPSVNVTAAESSSIQTLASLDCSNTFSTVNTAPTSVTASALTPPPATFGLSPVRTIRISPSSPTCVYVPSPAGSSSSTPVSSTETTSAPLVATKSEVATSASSSTPRGRFIGSRAGPPESS